MLKYDAATVRRLVMPVRGSLPHPFPGRFPTRVFSFDMTGWSYLGKPTPNAWRQIVRRTWFLGAPQFVEFDRCYIVRRRGGTRKTQFSHLMSRYYCADSRDFENLQQGDYPAFEPVRLREGALYFRQDWMARRPEWSRDDWFTAIRRRVRGVQDAIFLEPQAPVAMPEEPRLEGAINQREVEELFYQILRVEPGQVRRQVPDAPAPHRGLGALLQQVQQGNPGPEPPRPEPLPPEQWQQPQWANVQIVQPIANDLAAVWGV